MNEKLQELIAKLTADKKKFGLMCLLIMVGLLLWGRLILLDRVPKTVQADPNQQADTQPEAKAPPIVTVTYIGTLPQEAARDPFSIPRDRYIPAQSPDNPGAFGNRGTVSTDELPADIEEVRGEARALRLEGVIHGVRPRVVMNGQMFKTGDTHRGFKILAIEPHSAVVLKGGHLFRLRVTAAN
ncbi:MAG: hypothetical protein AAGI68_04275 [Planctomycetota bacterium]